MNILILSTHLNTGGISSYILTLANGLGQNGHRVFVMTSGGNLVKSLEKSTAKHIAVSIRTKSELSWRLYWPLGHIARFIRREKIDIIHAQTRVTQVMGYFLSKLTQVPLVSTCHGFFKPHFFRRAFPCWGKKVIAISRPVYDHLRSDFHVPADDVVLIPNGIDVEQFSMAAPQKIKWFKDKWQLKEGPVIGIIARLSDVKGHTFLIEAMTRVIQKIPSAQLLIVGEGPQERSLKDLVARLELSHCVHFKPIVSQTAEVLPALDVFVMPSLQEGLGLSVMEAQAAGVPVVASRVGGLVDLIEEGKTGLLVPSQNADELAQAIFWVLENKASALKMGQAARRSIEEKFSAERMVAATIKIYEQNSRRKC